LDREVRECIEKQRRKGAVITRFTVTAIGRAVVMRYNKLLLSEFGSRVTLTKQWAQSILHRMEYIQRKGSTKVHVPGNVFERLKVKFLHDIQATVAP
jgi:hypothetical protein